MTTHKLFLETKRNDCIETPGINRHDFMNALFGLLSFRILWL